MTVSVEILPGSRAILVTFEPPVTMPDDLAVASRRVSALMTAGGGGKFFRVTNFTPTTSVAVGDVLEIIAYDRQGYPGTSADPNIIPVIVGDRDLMRAIAEARHEHRALLDAPCFLTLDAALAHVRSLHA